jgi:hypothetical protein
MSSTPGGLTNRGTVDQRRSPRVDGLQRHRRRAALHRIGHERVPASRWRRTRSRSRCLARRVQVGMLSNRFLAFSPTTGKVRMSAQNDGATWDPTLYFQRGLGADPWQTMLVKPPNIWLIGTRDRRGLVRLGRVSAAVRAGVGRLLSDGTAAPYSLGPGRRPGRVARARRTRRAQFVAARGYGPTPISNFAIENALSTFTRAESHRRLRAADVRRPGPRRSPAGASRAAVSRGPSTRRRRVARAGHVGARAEPVDGLEPARACRGVRPAPGRQP